MVIFHSYVHVYQRVMVRKVGTQKFQPVIFQDRKPEVVYTRWGSQDRDLPSSGRTLPRFQPMRRSQRTCDLTLWEMSD